MDNHQEQLVLEKLYLDKVINIIEKQIAKEKDSLKNKKDRLIADRKDMYENTIHSSNDFEKLSDAIQYLKPLEIQTYDYQATEDRINKYERMQGAPYFARIDFTEESFEKESIYIGLGNLSDEKTHQTFICDWRAPISSIFYRFGLGKASYKAPYGTIEGEVSLKRQYEIKNGELKYFFDSNMTIIDDILKQALSQNSSSKMKSIVETIQKEQDIIVRDIENDLLIVQGVAGSGKTSVALHRVAYLMYHGFSENLGINNIMLITPNDLFAKYIDNVLPELGEKNVQTVTFEEIFLTIFRDKADIGNRNELIEDIITTSDSSKRELIKRGMEFKLSKSFITILDRYFKYFEHKMLDFRDIFYNGECIVNRHLIKSELLRQNDISLPLEKRLETIENRIMLKIHELRKSRLGKLEKFVAEYPEHIYEVKALARLLLMKENKAIKKEVSKFTRVDAREMLIRLIKDKPLFYRMSKGIELPENIGQILEHTETNLKESVLNYDNAMVLMALKLKIAGFDEFKDIKQLVVDEAQDYYPLQYEILKKMFIGSKFTIMGDINQSIEKDTDFTIYDDIKQIIQKKRNSTVIMKKSFRCSYEINKFSSCFSDKDIDIESFERHENKPEIIHAENQDTLDRAIISKIENYKADGFESIAVICKSMADSIMLFNRIGNKICAALMTSNSFESINKVTILPVYMAKGLEFDAVLLYQTNDENYFDPDDKKLLYISCTRALHRLSLFYSGELSRLIPCDSNAVNEYAIITKVNYL